MPKKEEQARCVIVSYICDECGEGEMMPGDVILPTHPPQIPHKCTKCDSMMNFNERMPMVQFLRWDQLTETEQRHALEKRETEA